MPIETESLFSLLNKTSEMEKLLSIPTSNIIPWQKTTVKTLHHKPEFILWKKQLIEQLRKLRQTSIVKETLSLLNNGFQTGFTDEQDFHVLQAKLAHISEHVDDYTIRSPRSQTMKKGTKIKTAFDEYTLIKQVGSGGNGRVFSAQNSDGEVFAIKFVERNVSSTQLKRFKNEVHFCEVHKHKNIVEVLDHGFQILNDTEYVFYVMPLYAETLREKMKAKLTPEQAVLIFTGILEGLSYAHNNKTIHRDIKPENIMFKADSLEPIICDFGIAHFAEDKLLTIVKTKKSDRLANFQYAAPEQRAKEELITTEQTDLYAAALILNEIFTGEIPQATDYKTISSVKPEYQFLDDVFLQLFKQNPQDRLASAEKVITEMKVQAERYKRHQEKLQLQKVIDDVVAPNDFELTVIKKEFVNGVLIFTLDQNIPYEWFQIISSGNLGNYTATVGYAPEKLKKHNENAICMQMYGHESASNISRIAENIISWIPKANVVYSNKLRTDAQKRQRAEEESRMAKIAKLDKENEINAILAKL